MHRLLPIAFLIACGGADTFEPSGRSAKGEDSALKVNEVFSISKPGTKDFEIELSSPSTTLVEVFKSDNPADLALTLELDPVTFCVNDGQLDAMFIPDPWTSSKGSSDVIKLSSVHRFPATQKVLLLLTGDDVVSPSNPLIVRGRFTVEIK